MVENVVIHSMVIEYLVDLGMFLLIPSTLFSHQQIIVIGSLSSSDFILIANHLVICLLFPFPILLHEFISIRRLVFILMLLIIISTGFNLVVLNELRIVLIIFVLFLTLF